MVGLYNSGTCSVNASHLSVVNVFDKDHSEMVHVLEFEPSIVNRCCEEVCVHADLRVAQVVQK